MLLRFITKQRNEVLAEYSEGLSLQVSYFLTVTGVSPMSFIYRVIYFNQVRCNAYGWVTKLKIRGLSLATFPL